MAISLNIGTERLGSARASRAVFSALAEHMGARASFKKAGAWSAVARASRPCVTAQNGLGTTSSSRARRPCHYQNVLADNFSVLALHESEMRPGAFVSATRASLTAAGAAALPKNSLSPCQYELLFSETHRQDAGATTIPPAASVNDIIPVCRSKNPPQSTANK